MNVNSLSGGGKGLPLNERDATRYYFFLHSAVAQILLRKRIGRKAANTWIGDMSMSRPGGGLHSNVSRSAAGVWRSRDDLSEMSGI